MSTTKKPAKAKATHRSTLGQPAAPKARIATDFESRAALAKSTQGGTAAPKPKGAVRPARFEVGDVEGDFREVSKRWFEISLSVQALTNEVWRQWLVWHEQNGTYDIAAKWYADLLAWHKAEKGERGEKPKLCVQPMPADCAKFIRTTMNRRFPAVNSRVKDLTLQATGKLITGRKSARGRLPGWVAVMLSHESIPSSTRPLPIRFDKSNADPKSWGKAENGDPVIHLRVDRIAVDGGTKADSTLDGFTIRLGTKTGYHQREILHRVWKGEYAFKGSMLQKDKRKNKWYFLLCYQKPPEPPAEVDAKKVARVWAGQDRPLILEIGDREIPIGGWGESVGPTRKTLFSQRMSRKHNYRYAGSANKGHGVNRALEPTFRLSRRWKDYVRTLNHTMTATIVRICLEQGVGKIVYHQPTGKVATSRFLATAGKQEWMRDANSWDWYQIGSQLKSKVKKPQVVEIDKEGEEDPAEVPVS